MHKKSDSEITRKTMNRNKIYHDLGFSIRKVNEDEDEIEIKNSTFDGYFTWLFQNTDYWCLLVIFIFRLSRW